MTWTPEQEVRFWFLDVIENAIWENSKSEMTKPAERLDKDPDGGLWYIDGKGGEFEVTLTVRDASKVTT